LLITFFITKVLFELFIKVIKYVEKFIELICHAIEGKKVCQGIFGEYAAEFVKNLFKKIFNPVEVCGTIGFCKNVYHVSDFQDYLKDVLADKPNKTIPQPTLKGKYKILHLTDLHIDFEYEEVFIFPFFFIF